MLKNFANEDTLQMDVFLKSGGKYLGCDMSTSAETVGVCKFWKDDVFIIIPWDEIKRVEVYQESDASKRKKK
jgi:hypothetical protein